MAKKGSSATFSYGYKRFSLLGAIINSIVLTVGSIFVLSAAIPRLFHPEATHAQGMFLLAIVGILVNGAAVFRLKKGNTINEKVVSLHLIEDVLGWAAILVGSVIMYFFDLPIIDPILSVVISIYVLSNVYKNLRQSLHIILQGIPDEMNITEISDFLKLNPAIEDVHDLHIWSIDGNYNVLTIHIVLKDSSLLDKLADIKNEIRDSLTQRGIHHATIEFETIDENCSMEKCCE